MIRSSSSGSSEREEKLVFCTRVVATCCMKHSIIASTAVTFFSYSCTLKYRSTGQHAFTTHSSHEYYILYTVLSLLFPFLGCRRIQGSLSLSLSLSLSFSLSLSLLLSLFTLSLLEASLHLSSFVHFTSLLSLPLLASFFLLNIYDAVSLSLSLSLSLSVYFS